MKKINYSNNDISLLNNEKQNNNNNNFIESNSNIMKNKWEKYFIPIVQASLINSDENQNENKKLYKKIDNKTNRIIHKKTIKFGDNNKKKRELLFNFNNKNENYQYYNYLNLSSKRTNSFISKRNKHITERNISIKNNSNYKYNSDIEFDLNQQERKLELIRNEISLEKKKDEMNKSNICPISVDNISNFYNNDNSNDEKISLKHIIINNKKFKTFHLKVNSFNIKQNNEKIIVKRGDLLNRLRNIKYNYSMNEEK